MKRNVKTVGPNVVVVEVVRRKIPSIREMLVNIMI